MFNKAVKKYFEITSPFQNGEADVWGLYIFMESFQLTVCNPFAHHLATPLITKDHT
jgi:hypothetical protein